MKNELGIAKQRIPWLMAGARALLGPVMILGERARWNGVTLAALVLTALLSDIFDGVLARRWKCDTAAVRLFDSMADIVFYVGCAIALWMRRPDLVRSLAVPIGAVLALETLCVLIAVVKFGKPPSYHSYLAKAWGLTLASALVAAFATRTPAVWIIIALGCGVLANLEGIAMSLIMPAWQQDVKTLAVAWRLRGIARRGRSRVIRRAVGAAAVLCCVAAISARAQTTGHVVYETGTTQMAANTSAPMIVTADGLRFEAPIPLAIPFDRIENAAWRKDVREHMGFFPAMFVGMVAARVHIYRLTLSYQNGSGADQVAVFQLSRNDAISLSELLRMRVPHCKEKGHCMPLYDY
jgi:CDP-diacylglycerol--glycerol-3-phosphate 3-phosphatidyltransferase